MNNNRTPNLPMMIIGVLVFALATAAWLYGERSGIDTTIIWTVATPVVGALFLVGPITSAAQPAQQAAAQTNGILEARMKSAMAAALADRDAARTRQARGDIAALDRLAPVEPDAATH